MAVRGVQRVAGAALLLAAGCSGLVPPTPVSDSEAGHCAKTRRFYESFVSGDASVPRSMVSPNEIQHNLGVGDRLAGYVALVEGGSVAKVDNYRCFETDELSFGHGAFTASDGVAWICMDIYRWNRGVIAEHWDNCQVLVDSETNPHTMVDGPTENCCQEDSEANVAAVEAMQREVFIEGRVDRVDAFFSPSYIQHNQNFADGLEPLVGGLRQLEKAGSSVCLSPRSVYGFGNFVLHTCLALDNPFDVMSPASTVNWDLFRMEGGKIAEHWDVVQKIPALKDWANHNGKF